MKTSQKGLIALCLSLVLLLSACSGGAYTLTYSNGAYRNEKQNAAFVLAPLCYRAASALTDETVAVIKSSYGKDVPLYAIEGMDTAKWLTDDQFDVYCNEQLALPSLSQMNASYVTLSYITYPFEIGRIEKAAEIADLVDRYENGTSIPAAKIIPPPENRFELLFFSNTYKGLAYSLEYWKFSEEVLVHAKLTEDGQIPNLYPGVTATIEVVNGVSEAVFHLGSGLVYDRTQDLFFPMGTQLESYFTGVTQ
ncbi:MAG: hypothetical protein E7620_05510 [Ruminococcaceae bacterium]|nr:hypothetical protein [Oscillospiraceae bacterium]